MLPQEVSLLKVLKNSIGVLLKIEEVFSHYDSSLQVLTTHLKCAEI